MLHSSQTSLNFNLTMAALFDPNVNKVINSYGGFDPNEKGLSEYPHPPAKHAKSDPFVKKSGVNAGKFSQHAKDVSNDSVLDSVSRHYRRFIQDPNLWNPEKDNETDTEWEDGQPEIKPSSCDIHKLHKPKNEIKPKRHVPIDPVHWNPNLFDTRHEKYYLTNLLNDKPYREDFLSSFAESATPYHFISETKQSFSGNPVVPPIPERIYGLGHPIDLTETCTWNRNQTRKLRDAIFTHQKPSIDSNLDYNDPKRYNPWPRLETSYIQMVTGDNYRPRPQSGVEYSVATLLPAVSTNSKRWVL